MTKYLDPKQPLEEFVQIVDFAPNLGAGETITHISAVPRVAPKYVHLADDAGTLVQQVLPSAGTARIVFQKGTHGVRYEVKVLVSTSTGNVWEDDLILDVWEFLH